MTKSNQTNAQAVHILGAALAVGMSLGMVSGTAAVAADEHYLKLDGMKGQTTIKGEGPNTYKEHTTIKGEGPNTYKEHTTIKMHGPNTYKENTTIKMQGTTPQ